RGREGGVGEFAVLGEQDDPGGGKYGGDRDAGDQPEPGSGVEHLAQLDGDDPGQRDRRYDDSARLNAFYCDGGHACAPSRWVVDVSSRNISSRPAPSAA